MVKEMERSSWISCLGWGESADVCWKKEWDEMSILVTGDWVMRVGGWIRLRLVTVVKEDFLGGKFLWFWNGQISGWWRRSSLGVGWPVEKEFFWLDVEVSSLRLSGFFCVGVEDSWWIHIPVSGLQKDTEADRFVSFPVDCWFFVIFIVDKYFIIWEQTFMPGLFLLKRWRKLWRGR